MSHDPGAGQGRGMSCVDCGNPTPNVFLVCDSCVTKRVDAWCAMTGEPRKIVDPVGDAMWARFVRDSRQRVAS